MVLFDIWIPITLFLTAPASLAYPFDTRSQSLTLTSPEVISQVESQHLGYPYPVYPTACIPPSSRGRRVRPSDLPNVVSDCSWIINEDLLQQGSLLFQELVFGYSAFKDQSGKRYSSRWHRGLCVVLVTCAESNQNQTLQLFNVVLAANKILIDCIQDQQMPQGGTVPIGSPDKSFYVGVLGWPKTVAGDVESSISPLSELDSLGRDVPGSLAHTRSNTKPSLGDHDANDSTTPPPDISMKKRVYDHQHDSSLSTSTQSLRSGGAWSIPDLAVPSTNLSGSFKAPANHPVQCFNPYSVKLKRAGAEDCRVVIDQIVLRYPNPMSPQTFGYGTSADIDLSLPENEKWIFRSCVVFVRNLDKTRTDTFRMVDVAAAAQRIVKECVVDSRYPMGGTSDVGSVADNFYVGVGGFIATHATGPSPLRDLSGVGSRG